MASSSTATDGAASTKNSSSGITANDFLTLLVTEMKNQDPTANTDPNEYINQLVNVNSLQQLISINETLTASLGSSSTNAYAQPAAQSSAVNASANTARTTTEAATTQDAVPALQTSLSSVKLVNGNLSVPDAVPAADRLSRALAGK
jgi:flagellar basal-body rod modification protein FlgD